MALRVQVSPSASDLLFMLTAMKKKSIAVVIVSNGPGELSTWVKPVITFLKKLINESEATDNIDYIFRLILVPCPNAMGKEHEVARNWNEFQLVHPAKKFWRLLINPSSFAKWPKTGIVVFLGGDQFWSVLLAKRLGYKNITYAEWIARWPRWIDIIAAMNDQVKDKIPKKFKRKCLVIGDLMADIQANKEKDINISKHNWIAILPGSKKTKLSIGIPYFLEVADYLSSKNSDINLMIPMAPTTSIEDYLFFQSDKNPLAKYYSSKIQTVVKCDSYIFEYLIETNQKTKIYVLNKQPNYEFLTQCTLAITTLGANTAELAAINLPMIVVLPTQHLNVMNSWDGIFGILGKVSFINKIQIFILKRWYLKTKKYFAWPNIKAKKIIIPERIGVIKPQEIAREVLFLLENKDYLNEQKINLYNQRGKKGAVKKLAKIIFKTTKNLDDYQGSSISLEFDN